MPPPPPLPKNILGRKSFKIFKNVEAVTHQAKRRCKIQKNNRKTFLKGTWSRDRFHKVSQKLTVIAQGFKLCHGSSDYIFKKTFNSLRLIREVRRQLIFIPLFLQPYLNQPHLASENCKNMSRPLFRRGSIFVWQQNSNPSRDPVSLKVPS